MAPDKKPKLLLALAIQPDPGLNTPEQFGYQ